VVYREKTAGRNIDVDRRRLASIEGVVVVVGSVLGQKRSLSCVAGNGLHGWDGLLERMGFGTWDLSSVRYYECLRCRVGRTGRVHGCPITRQGSGRGEGERCGIICVKDAVSC
jgi:hypothetical protein